MQTHRASNLFLYDPIKRHSSGNETHLTKSSLIENDPLRQQLTVYLNQFIAQPRASNLLMGDTKHCLPNLYAKAKKYSVFTLKRNPNRSFHNLEPKHRSLVEILPSLGHKKL